MVEVEAKAKVAKDKAVIEAKIPTKVNKNKFKSLITQIGAHVEEENIKEGGTKEDVDIIKEMMQIIVVARTMVD